jgi:hypothetical protein
MLKKKRKKERKEKKAAELLFDDAKTISFPSSFVFVGCCFVMHIKTDIRETFFSLKDSRMQCKKILLHTLFSYYYMYVKIVQLDSFIFIYIIGILFYTP